ncbi:MAG: XrtA system polysaccharide deacetylase [Planctomycetota bacterium]|jgi:polysaccharide deacetylase family protein (PEP-CTERM system associated)
MITAPDTNSSPPAAMSIDVEDWFHTENLKAAIARDSWDDRESRVERNTDRMLEMMARHDVRCTCFILGWVADKVPQLVKRIADAGHEVASHGYGHELIYEIGPDAFRRDIDRARKLLEDLTGHRVRGYRAPNFSITDWAIDLLQETGHEYDSSAFPTVAHDRYGKLSGMDAGKPVVELRPGFAEICVSCLKLGRRGLPWGGGGYFRLFPYRVFRSGVRRILGANQPYVFYIHPWEIDAGQPRVKKGLKASYRFRHYVNVDRGEARFGNLLDDFQWATMDAVLDWWRATAKI